MMQDAGDNPYGNDMEAAVRSMGSSPNDPELTTTSTPRDGNAESRVEPDADRSRTDEPSRSDQPKKPLIDRLGFRTVKEVTGLILILVTLLGGTVGGVVIYLAHQIAPNYKTEFVVDTSTKLSTASPKDIGDALSAVVQNAGDRDALALRRFGGTCGDRDNTARLVDFGINNGQSIQHEASKLTAGSQATLVRGVESAIDDFTGPFAQKAMRVNRIIVITGHGQDSCDADRNAMQQVKDRADASGLKLEMRWIGYRVPDAEQAVLGQYATTTSSPDPVLTNDPAELRTAINIVANLEPVAKDIGELIKILNGVTLKVNDALTASDFNIAQQDIKSARDAWSSTTAAFQDLGTRTKLPIMRNLYRLASGMRSEQLSVIDTASALIAAAQRGDSAQEKLQAFANAATTFNNDVGTANDLLVRALQGDTE